MNKGRFVAVVLALTLVSPPTISRARSIVHLSRDGVDASFISTDLAGCISTSVLVFASEQTLQTPPGPPDSPSVACVDIRQEDGCTATILLSAGGCASLADPDFRVIGTHSATLNATINVIDSETGSSFDVSVSLTWTGTGDATRRNAHFHFQTPSFIVNDHSNAIFRSAQASGSVSDGFENFTPNPSGFASIFTEREGRSE